MVNHRHVLRIEAGHIARPILTVHSDQQTREGRMPLPLHILYGQLQLVAHHAQIGFLYP